jgi:hypothetical protein
MLPRQGRAPRSVLSLLVLIAVLASAPGSARAYCRRSTCGGVAALVCTPSQADDCGIPVRWPDGPLSYALARSDEPLRRAIAAAIDRAFTRWRRVDCGGGSHPDLAVVMRGAEVPDARRASIELSDEPAVRGAGTLAVTRLFFAPDTGQILRAHVTLYSAELRSHGEGVFLDSIAVHEIGHVLGLGHSMDPAAVMSEDVHDGTTARVELAGDDIAAICAIYPPHDVRHVWQLAIAGSVIAIAALAMAATRR